MRAEHRVGTTGTKLQQRRQRGRSATMRSSWYRRPRSRGRRMLSVGLISTVRPGARRQPCRTLPEMGRTGCNNEVYTSVFSKKSKHLLHYSSRSSKKTTLPSHTVLQWMGGNFALSSQLDFRSFLLNCLLSDFLSSLCNQQYIFLSRK